MSGGGQDVLHVFTLDGDAIRQTDVVPAGVWPAGLAYGRTPAGPRLYVANNLAADPGGLPPPRAGTENPPGHTVTVIDPGGRDHHRQDRPRRRGAAARRRVRARRPDGDRDATGWAAACR